MKLRRVGVDLAKNVYQLHGVDPHGGRQRSASLGAGASGYTVKSVEQQDIQATHRVRSEIKDQRNA